MTIHGNAAEEKVIDRLGAKHHGGSGSVAGHESDGSLGRFRIESKATVHRSMILELEWLEKITREARAHSQEPLLVVQFVTGDGEPRKSGSWLMVPEDVWRRDGPAI